MTLRLAVSWVQATTQFAFRWQRLPKNLPKPCTVGRQAVVVAEVVLAELAGPVARGLCSSWQRRVTRVDPDRRARQADGGEAGADRQLPGDEAARPAVELSCMVVGEQDAFAADAVDVGVGTIIPWL